MQTRLGSIIEATVNILIGAGVAFVSNLLILPAFGFSSLTAESNLAITGWFTVISFFRGYLLRRLFTRIRRWHTT